MESRWWISSIAYFSSYTTTWSIHSAHAAFSCWLFGAAGRLNVKQEEIDDMLKEAPGPVNFTVFLTMFGEKLKGEDAYDANLTGDIYTWVRQGKHKYRCGSRGVMVSLIYAGADPEETILNAFKVFDPEGKGVLRKD